MNRKAFVLKTEGALVWLAPEPESCSICPDAGANSSSCAGCEVHAPPPFAARNSRGLDLKPGMKVLASFPQGRALLQAAFSFGIPLAVAIAAYLAAPSSPAYAKPLAALAALALAALAACVLSALMRKKFPRAYGEMEVAEILEEPAYCRFKGAAGSKGED